MCATISPVQRRTKVLAVFLASLAILGWNAGAPGLATSYVDPLAKIQAQDEAYYVISGGARITVEARSEIEFSADEEGRVEYARHGPRTRQPVRGRKHGPRRAWTCRWSSA